MTGRELIRAIIDNKAEDNRIVIGCQGYLSEYNSDDEVRIVSTPGTDTIVICDSCYYPDID